MMRFVHLLAITILIGSAGYAYSIKYETLYYAETLTKLKAKLQKEREAIAVSKAEWALLTRPDRLQRMVERHLDLQPMSIAQLARLSDLPTRPQRGDVIAAKLDTLGIDPVSTGSVGSKAPPKRDAIGAKLQSLLGVGDKRPAVTPKPGPAR